MNYNRNNSSSGRSDYFNENRRGTREPVSSNFESQGGRERNNFRGNNSEYGQSMQSSPYSHKNAYEEDSFQYGNETSPPPSYFDRKSKDDHQRKYPQTRERSNREQHAPNFGGQYNDVDSSTNNGGFNNQNERYNEAGGYERRDNIRDHSTRGNGRDILSLNSGRNQNNYSNEENDRNGRNAFPQASNSINRFSSTNQENSYDERSNRDVPARGMYAAGRSSYRPDSNEKKNSATFGRREEFTNSNEDTFRTSRISNRGGREWNNWTSTRSDFDESHSGYEKNHSNRSLNHSDEKYSRPARGGYHSERQPFDNNSRNGHFSNDSGRRNYDGNYSSRGRGGHNESRGYNNFGDERDTNGDGFDGKRDNFNKNHRFSENGNNYGDDDEFGNSNRGGSRGSFRGGRGRGRHSYNSEFGNSFDSRGPRNEYQSSENPATDPASRAPRGWVPEQHDVEKYFEEDRNKEKYSEFDMDEKFKTTGGKDIQYKTWEETGLHEKLLKDLVEKCHFKKLRPIQGRVIPHVLANKNLLGHSQTGSGKTLAYVLPILHHLLNSDSFGEKIFYNPKVLVLVPTRELAVQVCNEFRKFASGTNINVGAAYGQYSRNQNRADIAHSHVIVGTIGRVKDFISTDLDVKNLSHIVLDEADKILKDTDRAFRDMIGADKFKKIIPRCQVLMFTATLPESFDKLTDDLLGDSYVTITNEERLKANNHVEQIYVYTESRKEKHEELRKIIENYSNVKILIFVKTKDMADILSASFEQEGIKVESLHGGRPQDLRNKIFNNFKAGGTQIVIGTDVCGRGWDVDGLDIVVNFDMPSAKESLNDCLDTFIHRIGRTGRMKMGKAITFIGEEDKDFVPHLIKLCQASQQEVPEFMLEMEKSFAECGISRTFGDSASHSAGQPSFGRTDFGSQSNTNDWDLTCKSADDTEVHTSAAPNSNVPISGDPWASSNGWGESTQNNEPTIEYNDTGVNDKGESHLFNVPSVVGRSPKSEYNSKLRKEDNMKSDVTSSFNAQDSSFGTYDDWDTSGADWGSGTAIVKANVQSEDEDENLLPSDSKEDGGGDY